MTNDDTYEPAVLVKHGTPLVKPHDHSNHFPGAGSWEGADGDEEWVPNPALVDGAVFRCTCGDHYRYFENSIAYMYSYDTALGSSHWARSDAEGRLYRWTNVSPRWKKFFGVNEMQYVLEED